MPLTNTPRTCDFYFFCHILSREVTWALKNQVTIILMDITAGKESIFFGNVHISSPQTRGINWWTHIQSFRALELLQPSAGGNPIGVPIGAPKKNQWIYVHLHRDHADHSLRSCMPYHWLFYCQMMYLRLWACTEPSTSVSCGRRFFMKGYIDIGGGGGLKNDHKRAKIDKTHQNC